MNFRLHDLRWPATRFDNEKTRLTPHRSGFHALFISAPLISENNQNLLATLSHALSPSLYLSLSPIMNSAVHIRFVIKEQHGRGIAQSMHWNASDYRRTGPKLLWKTHANENPFNYSRFLATLDSNSIPTKSTPDRLCCVFSESFTPFFLANNNNNEIEKKKQR